MSTTVKKHEGSEKAEKTKETVVGKKTPEAQSGAPKEHSHADTPRAGKTKSHNPMPGGCFAVGCKAHASQFNFCTEHYDHFKFGLIKKTGEPVVDYEKKFGHYQAYKAKKGATRAA